MNQNITLFYKECTDNKLDEYETSKSERLDLFVYDEIKQSYIELDYDKTNYDIKAQYIIFFCSIIILPILINKIVEIAMPILFAIGFENQATMVTEMQEGDISIGSGRGVNATLFTLDDNYSLLQQVKRVYW